MLMTTLTNIRKFRKFGKRHTNDFEYEKNLDQMKSRNYKYKKQQLRSNWTLVLSSLKSTHVNDYDMLDEVA